jgi:hypothetical protein
MLEKRKKRFPLPLLARSALRDDRNGLPNFDPGLEAAIRASLEWLGYVVPRK